MKEELLTTHAKQRLNERVDKSNSQMSRLLSNALRCGKLADELPKGRLKEFIKNKANCNYNRKHKVIIKYFQEYVWVFGRNNILITMYRVPDRILVDYKKRLQRKLKPIIDEYSEYEKYYK